MTVNWTNEDADFHVAECDLGAGVVVQLLVESLGEHGWDWQMWDPSRCLRTGYGVADTLEEAKVQAELAVATAMARARMTLTEMFQLLGQAA